MNNIKLSDQNLLKTDGYINGEWISNSKKFSVKNPATKEVICQVSDLGAKETAEAISFAQTSMEKWRNESVKTRSQILKNWYQEILNHQEDLALLMTLEQGKVLAESKGEILYGASFVEWYAEEAKRVYGDIIPSPFEDRKSLVIKQAVGVVGAITPWNFPNAMITRKVAPALAVGCAIVLKPAEETPLSALALAELADRVGIPKGLFNVIPTSKAREVGAELTSNKIVKKITFTGSTPVGKILMEQSAKTVKRTSMELGGNAPVVVFADCDLDKAINGVIANKYRNSGQTCICANRILVEDKIYDKFVEKLNEKVSNFNLGNGLEESTTHGPLITNKASLKVKEIVQDAVSKGAKIITGGKIDNLGENFFQPTILTNVNSEMRIAKEEIFGPVAPIYKFNNEDEAIKMANDTDFGLAAYLFTKNIGTSWRVSEKLEFGMIGVNEIALGSDMTPFGGIKESGQGREGSKYGLDDYLEIKYICMGGL